MPGVLVEYERLFCNTPQRLWECYTQLTDGRTLVRSRYTVPEPDQQLILDKLNWALRTQPPPPPNQLQAQWKLLPLALRQGPF